MSRAKLFNGELLLFIDQYGGKHWASSRKDLRRQLPGRISKMYRDKKDGSIVHIGYVIGPLWLTAYQHVEVPA